MTDQLEKEKREFNEKLARLRMKLKSKEPSSSFLQKEV